MPAGSRAAAGRAASSPLADPGPVPSDSTPQGPDAEAEAADGPLVVPSLAADAPAAPAARGGCASLGGLPPVMLTLGLVMSGSSALRAATASMRGGGLGLWGCGVGGYWGGCCLSGRLRTCDGDACQCRHTRKGTCALAQVETHVAPLDWVPCMHAHRYCVGTAGRGGGAAQGRLWGRQGPLGKNALGAMQGRRATQRTAPCQSDSRWQVPGDGRHVHAHPLMLRRRRLLQLLPGGLVLAAPC